LRVLTMLPTWLTDPAAALMVFGDRKVLRGALATTKTE
jgi:hypothetical protein